MDITRALLTPKKESTAVELASKLYRKQILPKARITYKGRVIDIDDQYLTDLATAFKDEAMPQVPLQFSDDKNTHTMDPERFRGEMKGVEVGEDGLYGIFTMTESGAKVLHDNPNL